MKILAFIGVRIPYAPPFPPSLKYQREAGFLLIFQGFPVSPSLRFFDVLLCSFSFFSALFEQKLHFFCTFFVLIFSFSALKKAAPSRRRPHTKRMLQSISLAANIYSPKNLPSLLQVAAPMTPSTSSGSSGYIVLRKSCSPRTKFLPAMPSRSSL